MEEFMFLGLRLTKVSGIDFISMFSMALELCSSPVMEHLISGRLLEKQGSGFPLTEWGMDVSNYVLSEFCCHDL